MTAGELQRARAAFPASLGGVSSELESGRFFAGVGRKDKEVRPWADGVLPCSVVALTSMETGIRKTMK